MKLSKTKPLIKLALKEDLGIKGDITTNFIIPKDKKIEAIITAKEPGIICGLDVARLVFETIDKSLKFKKVKKEGSRVKKGQIVARVKGRARGILTGERIALNFLQRLSGMATLTERFASKLKGYKTVLLDTRKTTPGLRILEKYATKVGGATNHRFGLYDAILVKDNHIKIAGSISRALEKVKEINPCTRRFGGGVKNKKIEIEVTNLIELREALQFKVGRVMLDNMSPETMKKAVVLIREKSKNIEIEASGGVNLKTIKKIADCGVDYISVGAITHSAKALDISMKIK